MAKLTLFFCSLTGTVRLVILNVCSYGTIRASGTAVIYDADTGLTVATRSLKSEVEDSRRGWILFEDPLFKEGANRFTLHVLLELEATFIKFDNLRGVLYIPHDWLEPKGFLPPKVPPPTQRVIDLSEVAPRLCDLFYSWLHSGVVPPLKDVFMASDQLFVEAWRVAARNRFHFMLVALGHVCTKAQFWRTAQYPEGDRRLFDEYRSVYFGHEKAAELVEYAAQNWEVMADDGESMVNDLRRMFQKFYDNGDIGFSFASVMEHLQKNHLHLIQTALVAKLGAPGWVVEFCAPLLDCCYRRQ